MSPPNEDRSAPHIEALIVSYETRGLLRQTIMTLLENPPPAEVATLTVAVIDNASGDGSAEMIEQEFPTTRLVRSERNLGFAAANNRLAETSTATHLLLLNPDVIVVEDFVTPLLVALDTDPSAAVAGPRLSSLDGAPQYSSERFPTLRFELARALRGTKAGIALRRLFDPDEVIAASREHALLESRETRHAEFLWATCWLAAREEIVLHGLFDERYLIYDEDLDFCRRLRQRGRTALFVPGAHLVHLGGASSTTAAKEAMMQRGRERYFRDHHGRLSALIYRFALVPLTSLKRASRHSSRPRRQPA
jgi:N-acetylglucosaminyl-diphospho-decaprenol L-rhamnosyltransferase